MIDFSEERLELGINYGAVGGMRFNTTVLETGTGGQQRNVNWWLPLGRWQLGDRSLREDELEQEVTYLKDFHAARKGSLQGFRFKDWSDYRAENQVLGIGNGVQTQYQLKKTYFAEQASCDRPIIKPVEGSVQIYFDGVVQHSGWTIDHTIGVVTFAIAPSAGVSIATNFEFDLPCWFESDSIGWRLEGYEQGDAIYQLESVFVEEGRIPLALPWEIEPIKPNLEQVLDIGIYEETTETIVYQTSKQKLSSGYVRRDSNYSDPIIKLNLGDRNLDSQEVERLLGFFWCAKGQARLFNLRHQGKNYLGRFGQDNLSLRFEGYDQFTEEKIFYLSGLTFESTNAFSGLLNYIDNQTYVVAIIDASGSMNNSIPAITTALDNLKVLLQNNVYGTEESANKYFKIIQDGSEQWVNFLNADHRDNRNEPDKIVFLCWINEAAPIYHNISNTGEPTTVFSNDLANFLNTTYPQRIKFRAIIYSVIFNDSIFPAFQNHLTHAYLGQNGYSPALKDYDIEIRLDIPEATTADDYFADFIGTEIVGTIPN